MYSVGDKIVHPMHGAGVIADIESRKDGKEVKQYYVLKLPTNKMVVMIPTISCDDIGVRPIIREEEIEDIYAYLRDIEVEFDSNWNTRYRENMLRIKSGDIHEVAKVVKLLYLRDIEKGLSTGERKMLHSAKQIMISEIVLSTNEKYELIESRIIKSIKTKLKSNEELEENNVEAVETV